MTLEDSAKMLVISQCEEIRETENSLWGDFRQTLGEIRADFQDCIMDFEQASDVWIRHAEIRMPATFGINLAAFEFGEVITDD